METSEAVAKIAEAYADAEDAAASIKAKFAGCKDAWQALVDNGVIGNLEMQMRSRRLNVLAAAFGSDVFALHYDDTQRANELGVDLPQPRSGGGR